MAFSIIAKGEGKTYLLTEGIDAVIGVCLNIWFYTRYGLAGIGFAQVIWYGVYTIMTGVIYFGRYRLRLGKGTVSKSEVYRISTIHLRKRRKRRSMGVKILSSSEIS